MHTKYAIIFIKENVNNEQRFGFVASKKLEMQFNEIESKEYLKNFVKNT